MSQDESIYNIIPEPKKTRFINRLYRSKHSPHQYPTSSTFNLHGTSFPSISNCGGETSLPLGGHPMKGKSMTFGLPIGSYRPDPKNYHKKGERIFYYIPKILFRSQSEIKKPPIPNKNDIGIILPKKEKNYVISNASDNFLMKKKKIFIKNNSINFLRKKNYGKIPQYIFTIKKHIEDEKKHLLDLKKKKKEEESKLFYKLSDNELKIIREGLSKKMENLRREYGIISHKKVFDTIKALKRKEDLENQLNVIENDIKIMKHSNIFVDSTLK